MQGKNSLKVIVMTQKDKFFIPHNIALASQVCEIQEVVIVNCKSALENKTKDYLKWFGFFQCFKMGLKSIKRTLQGVIDKIFRYKLYKGECSIKHTSRVIGAKYKEISNSNSEEFVEYIRQMSPDLIISYSAPQILKPELLAIPKHGIINVHGSLLPDYRGCLPSFWYLFNEEQVGGASVHYMSERIDDGGIIKQGEIDIRDCKTMMSLIAKTKKLGGQLMVEAITDISNDNVVVKPNNAKDGRYFTWPTQEEAKLFRKKGKSLI